MSKNQKVRITCFECRKKFIIIITENESVICPKCGSFEVDVDSEYTKEKRNDSLEGWANIIFHKKGGQTNG